MADGKPYLRSHPTDIPGRHAAGVPDLDSSREDRPYRYDQGY